MQVLGFSLTNNDVFEDVGVVVWCSGHCGSERQKIAEVQVC